MRRIFNSVVGILLIAAAVVGLVASLAGIVGISAAQQRLAAGVTRQLVLLDQALTATDAGLRTAEDAVGQTRAALTSMQGTVDASAGAIDDIAPSIEAMAVVTGDQLPATLEAAGQSLTAFASTAEVIDRAMKALDGLPLVTIPAYDPEVSLAESIKGFRDSLAGMPEELTKVQTGLRDTATNLREIRGQVAGVGGSLAGLDGSLESTVGVLRSYQAVVDDLRGQMQAAAEQIDQLLGGLRIALIVALVWLGIASLGMLALGMDLLQRGRVEPAAQPRPEASIAG